MQPFAADMVSKMAIYHSPNISTTGLILCLDANNPRCYPGSGNTLFDLSFEKNNGTTSSLVIVNDTFGKSISGNSSSITVSLSTNTRPNKYRFSLSYWGRPTATPDGNYQSIFYFRDANTTPNAYFLADTREVATPYVLHYVKDFATNNWDTRQMISTARYNQFDWDYYTLVVSAENVWKSYLNGVLLGTNSTPTQDLSGYANNIGSLILCGGVNFNLSHVTVYNRVLSDSEVYSNYNALKTRFGK